MRAGTGGVCVGETDCKTTREAWEVCGRLGYAERRKGLGTQWRKKRRKMGTEKRSEID